MLWSPSSQSNRRVFSAVALAVLLLLTASPASLVGQAEQPSVSADETTNAPQITSELCLTHCQLPTGLSVATIFPFAGDRDTPKRSEEDIIGLADDQADELFSVLASENARNLLQELSKKPQTASELTEEVDTSLQNVHYHLENLHEAGAITEISVEYSERGREMSVYTAVCQPQLRMYSVK